MEKWARVALENLMQAILVHIKKGPNFKHPKSTSLYEKIDESVGARGTEIKTCPRRASREAAGGAFAASRFQSATSTSDETSAGLPRFWSFVAKIKGKELKPYSCARYVLPPV
ncbi:hypothetical protein EVAR_92532_1 [Eumeta japonica]|uniref:Uncharacterized protein n=1 Tax=Eumeta variegata TaxID=151549 RepID=A0A4C1T697_EUMVA|nr:hypothetical protein EVAR_92532_1 [Eumeta japonica]